MKEDLLEELKNGDEKDRFPEIITIREKRIGALFYKDYSGFIFPRRIIMDKEKVVYNQKIIASKEHRETFFFLQISNIRLDSGFLFSKIIIENSGGDFPIVVPGIGNKEAKILDSVSRIRWEAHSRKREGE